MAEPVSFAIDIAKLLQPISARAPAGEWLRYEGTYDAVQEARREEDESLPRGIWTSKVKRADWAKVDALCQDALRERTKDLQLAAWLAEAWLHLYGLRGFAGGLKLCAELLSQFWQTLYPLIDESEASYRLAPVEFLDRKVALRLKLLPLVQAPKAEQPALTFIDWERALYNDKLSQASGGGELSPAQFLAAAAATPPQWFITLHADLLAVDRAAMAVEAAVMSRTGEQNLVLRGLRALIRDITVLIAQYTPEVAQPADLAGAAPGSGPAQGAEAQAGGTARSASPNRAEHEEGAEGGSGARAASEAQGGPIRSRAEAFRRLAEAADFLLRTEPHSPVPYLIKRAISWGNLSLVQLLPELVGSEADRRLIHTMLGIQAPR
ncbi:MAG TPA: type VI secretion system protein TssA [Pseudomonadota bacterium]|nr:type VI secretion system protein TssA [Pseudomonadota bacterium]